jgi:cytidylate kinase
MTVIAMTREMGTLGKDVALKLSVQMELALVHHQLVEQDIAKRLSVEVGDVHRFLEGNPSLLNRWKIDENRLSRYTKEEILKLAQKGNVIIRGWGAAYLLKDIPHVMRVRICAPMKYRTKCMMDRLGLADAAVARREIERNDAAHTRTMRQFFDADWENPLHYHLTLNTGSVPVSACIDQIRQLAGNALFKATEESRGKLADKLIETRIRLALEQNVGSSLDGRMIDIAVHSGKVTLTGATSRQAELSNLEDVTRQTKGVTAVENRIVRVDPHYMG